MTLYAVLVQLASIPIDHTLGPQSLQDAQHPPCSYTDLFDRCERTDIFIPNASHGTPMRTAESVGVVPGGSFWGGSPMAVTWSVWVHNGIHEPLFNVKAPSPSVSGMSKAVVVHKARQCPVQAPVVPSFRRWDWAPGCHCRVWGIVSVGLEPGQGMVRL